MVNYNLSVCCVRLICIYHIYGSSNSIGKSWRQKILAQTNVLKPEEYCVYFPVSELHGWGKRFAVQSQTIYSEVPYNASIMVPPPTTMSPS